jgi:uncharacterized protein YbaA (DUF1428 family)
MRVAVMGQLPLGYMTRRMDMTYYQTFVAPVPKARLDEYFALAKKMTPLWKAYGALSVVDARPDNAPSGKLTSFPQAVICAEDEVPVLSFVTFRDRAHCDEVMEKAMTDPAMETMMMQAPLDGKRMIIGGFLAEVDG